MSLYIHIPWCIKKCPYCDFNSHVLRQELPEKNYLDAILIDFKNQLSYLQTRQINTVFIGGGTPSLMSPEFYHTLIEKIRPYLTENAEITLEANPGSIDFSSAAGKSKFHLYRAAGINRLSLGLQSFEQEKLKQLGRIHSPEESLKAIDLAIQAGFENLNGDLMFGLPNQTIAQALSDLKKLIDQKPAHISWYQLTLEPNTYFYRHPPILPADDRVAQMHQEGQALLAAHGYEQYEVSAYAKKNHYCRHNLNYWLFGDYLGIGAGAHGKISDPDQQLIVRTLRPSAPKNYMSSLHKPMVASVLPCKEVLFEFLLNTLRLYQPIPFTLFEERCYLNRTVLYELFNKIDSSDLLTYDAQYFSLTRKGQYFVDDILMRILD